ncbi:alanine racemase [Alteromonas halophila]|uniref:Alanine racemase n=1 Tax=Alteromonas halophila TaxID=516698 RepID=A0A918MWG5_9ALTE|nr:alanine racemase [Alteromonas halophila]GGW79496.1 alanine racemase [Alteromonas halophila]
MSRQTQAIIHANAITENFSVLQALAPQSKPMAVIKADAYGHGAVTVARLLRDQAVRFAVAIIEEAIALREAGITAPIVVLEGPHQPKECYLARQNDCVMVMHSEQQLQWASDCTDADRPAIWIKVDSGMHRLGFSLEDTPRVLNRYRHIISDESVLVTHLASADDLQSDFTQRQLQAFRKVSEDAGLPVSIANSPATIAWPQSRGDWNRLGVALFGSGPPLPEGAGALRPAMTLRSSVMALHAVPQGEAVGYGQMWTATRDSIIATVGIGYADGYPRHCPNGTPVMIKGQRAALVGRVSMDMITIDVTDIAGVKMGDRVELWGAHIPIDEVAAWAGSIGYELMTRVSARVPRIVRHD